MNLEDFKNVKEGDTLYSVYRNRADGIWKTTEQWCATSIDRPASTVRADASLSYSVFTFKEIFFTLGEAVLYAIARNQPRENNGRPTIIDVATCNYILTRLAELTISNDITEYQNQLAAKEDMRKRINVLKKEVADLEKIYYASLK